MIVQVLKMAGIVLKEVLLKLHLVSQSVKTENSFLLKFVILVRTFLDVQMTVLKYLKGFNAQEEMNSHPQIVQSVSKHSEGNKLQLFNPQFQLQFLQYQ